MQYIQKYAANRVKDGSLVVGYAAIGYESTTAWIMVPTKGTTDQFHMVQVNPESIVPLM